jgi:dTDP-4-dehydrorhamnose reductase
MRVAVTGAGGRLGSSIVRLLRDSAVAPEVLAWDIPEHDLDDPLSADRLVAAGRPDLVVHCAAWTDVDGCAREPALAMRRNGTAAGEIAVACANRGASMIAISTNEVYAGARTDGHTYAPGEATYPINPYGAAKLRGETLARAAFGASGAEFATAAARRAADAPAADGASRAGGAQLAIVRTAWLFGAPGLDFPRKILAAARRTRDEGGTLALVADETGNPTYAPDLAGAVVRLVGAAAAGSAISGIHHVVNAGAASRAEWAREVLRLAGVDVPTRDVPLSTWPRPSTPPPRALLEPTPLPGGPLRAWQEALREYLAQLPAEETR